MANFPLTRISPFVFLSFTSIALLGGCGGANRIRYGESKARVSSITGVFVQGVGFCSGGYQQYIYLKNLASGRQARIQVKDVLTSAKTNLFSAKIPAGSYSIESYQYGCGNWIHFLPFVRARDLAEFQKILEDAKKDPINRVESGKFPKYQITVPKNRACVLPLIDFSGRYPILSKERKTFREMARASNKKFDPDKLPDCEVTGYPPPTIL